MFLGSPVQTSLLCMSQLWRKTEPIIAKTVYCSRWGWNHWLPDYESGAVQQTYLIIKCLWINFKGSLLWYMWRYINSSKPLCYRSLIIGHFCENNAFFILLSWLPTYFHENFPDAKVILVQCLMLVVLSMHV